MDFASPFLHVYKFLDDNKQEILEPKLFFVSVPWNELFFVEEVLESMNKIFQEYLLDDPVFRLVAILKSIKKNFEKQIQRNSLLR